MRNSASWYEAPGFAAPSLAHGCSLLREGGSHSWWHNPVLNRRSAVPRHSEVSDHLARKICKDLGVAQP